MNLDEMDLYGIGGDEGAPFPINCVKCKKRLTIIYLNERCTIDIKVECFSCGLIARGNNLWAQKQGTMRTK